MKAERIKKNAKRWHEFLPKSIVCLKDNYSFSIFRKDLAAGVTDGRADAVLAASIFHYGEYTVRQAKEHMARRGIEVRL